MNVPDNAALEEKLAEIYPHHSVRLTEPWEQSAWSRIYKVEFASREPLILKGTPRQRPESCTTAILHQYCPDLIPKNLNEDLLPDSHWRWFLLESVGESNQDHIEPVVAVRAAYQMGRLQKAVCQDAWLAELLPQCRADNLYEAVSKVCEWAAASLSTEGRISLSSIQAGLVQARSLLREIGNHLALLPSTCVHGDLWIGNITIEDDHVHFVDWGDALWGVGSLSITHLFDASDGALADCVEAIWEAYARGWEIELTDELMCSSQVAAVIGNLIVDMEIANCCGQTAAWTPGLFPNLELLVKLLKI